MGYADFPDTFKEQVQKLLRGREDINKLRIGVISPDDLYFHGDTGGLNHMAVQVGEYIARANAVLILGINQPTDIAHHYCPIRHDAFSPLVRDGATKAGGIVQNTSTYYANTLDYDALISIDNGMLSMSQILDAVFLAQRKKVPMIVLCESNNKKLDDSYLELSKGYDIEIVVVNTAEQAVLKAIELNCWKWMTGGLEH